MALFSVTSACRCGESSLSTWLASCRRRVVRRLAGLGRRHGRVTGEEAQAGDRRAERRGGGGGSGGLGGGEAGRQQGGGHEEFGRSASHVVPWGF